MICYKVLNSNLKSPFQNYQYELNNEYICDDFDDNPLKGCSRGLYATPTIEGCLYTNLSGGKVVVQCETGGRCVDYDLFKVRWEIITPIKLLTEEETRSLAKSEGENRGYNIEGALFPIHPFSKEYIPDSSLIKLLNKWASVRASVRDSLWDSLWDSVWASVRASVRDSVWASVRDSVRDSVWASVRDSVRDSVCAYISSLFPNINFNYDFSPAIELWNAGLIPVFYNSKKCLFGHKNGVAQEIYSGV